MNLETIKLFNEMIKGLKNKINEIVDQKIEYLKDHQQKVHQTALDYAQIIQLFPEAHFIPFTTFTISPSVILHILNDIVINQRRNIIEFGSGASTLFIARLIKISKMDAKFYSVDSNINWLKKMKKDLIQYNLDDVVTLIYAPLREVPEDFGLKTQKLWYDTEKITDALGDNHELDLIIIDGPFGKVTPYARYSAIPFLQARLLQNYSIFLDDAEREEEREIAKQWSRILKLETQKFNRYVHFSQGRSFITSPFSL